MSRVFITGDTHGDIDIKKLTSKCFPKGRNLTSLVQWGILFDFLVDSSVDGREFARMMWLVSPDKSWEYVYTILKVHKLV